MAKSLFLFRAYLALCKPRVVLLMLLTSLVGMLLAAPAGVPIYILCFGLLGIGLTAGAGAAINHLLDREIDKVMSRTKHRPLPVGELTPLNAFIFAIVLALIGLTLLITRINGLTALLTFISFIGYAVIYTVFLKHATSQNIVIGGAAGATPPLLGWTAVTGTIDANALLLVLIIFVWTPPHFWALALNRLEEYAHAKIPMLPVTHGVEFTKTNILLYTILLSAVSLLPVATRMSGLIYLCGTLLLNAGFLYWTIKLKYFEKPKDDIKTFRYSIIYLMGLFVLLLVDHYIL